jgi:O-antigen/teichoic acid export membrane protein
MSLLARLQRFRRIGASMLASMLLQARNLIVSLVVFRMFSDPNAVWGTVNNVLVVVTVLALPAKFGLEFTGVQLVSKYRADRPDLASLSLRRTAWLRLALGVCVAAPMLFAPGWVGSLTGLGDVPHLVVLGGWLLLSTSAYEYTSLLLSGTDNFGAMARNRVVYTLANVAGIAWAAWRTTSGGDGAYDIVLAQVAAASLAFVGGAIALWREDARLRSAPVGSTDGPDSRTLWLDIWRFSLPMLLVNGSGQLFSYLGRLVLPILADRSVLGAYALAESAVSAAVFGTYAFRNVARTRLPGLLRNDPGEAREVLLANYRANLAVASVIAAGAVAAAPSLFRVLYGPDAEIAASLMPVFAPYILISTHGNLSATALAAADKPRAYAALLLVCGLVGVGLNAAFIPSLGAAGAVVGGTLSNVPLAVVAWVLVARAYGFSTVEVLRGSLVTCFRLALYFILPTLAGLLVAGPTWTGALGAGVVVVATFGLLIAATGELARLRAAL